MRTFLARPDVRLLSLTGAGGSGKSRLALELARELAPSFANGAVLVELASLSDPALVLPTIARALDLEPGADAQETLVDALADREVLLVIDNLEHLRTAAAALVRLLAVAPRLVVIATTRVVLHVSGEHVYPVAPLGEADAIRLFAGRTRAQNPTFELDTSARALIASICRRLDGLPLAIELAAARVRNLGLVTLDARLASRLSILTGGPRDLPARQQTLRETIAWSVRLLSERERDVFVRLAVFPGGATLEAAEHVCGANLDTLESLVDHHLVQCADVGGEPRFSLLETVRDYALELSGGAQPGAELALARYFADRADALRLAAPVEREWGRAVALLELEIDNVRLALATAAASGDGELQVRLAGGLWRYWFARGSVGEGLEWIERALAAPGPATPARAAALRGGAGLAWMRGDLERAKALASAAIPVAVVSGSTWDELSAHTVLGIVANEEGDGATARRHHHRSLELKEQLGVEPVVEMLNLGLVALDAEEYEEAVALFEGVLDYALQGLAAAEAHGGNFERAARLLGKARRELDEVGTAWDKFSPALISATEAAARGALGDKGFAAAYAAGLEPRD